jgi:protein-disulfide isomerase
MSKKQQLRELQQRQAKKQRTLALLIGGGIGVVVIGGFILLGLVTRPEIPPPVYRPKDPVPASDDTLRAWGPKDAPIKVVEYMDYQCPVCGAYANNSEPEIIKQFAGTGKVRYEVKVYPVIELGRNSRESTDAAQASLCAAEQGKFWQMHSGLFQSQWQENRGGFGKPRIKQLAALVDGLDVTAFGTCLDSDKHRTQVQADTSEAQSRGVNSTPTFFVNNVRLSSGGLPTAATLRQEFSRIAPNVRFE